jgi:hypothetical protein
MLEIISIIVVCYMISILINLYYIRKAHLFELKLDWVFTIVYLLFSPLVLPFTIGRSFEVWYEDIVTDQAILRGLRLGVNGTKYDTLTDAQLMELKDVLAENEQYVAFDSFEEIFEDLERRGIIVVDTAGCYNINKTTDNEE